MFERRLSPRYSLPWPLRLRGHEAAAFDAEMADISATGVGLLASRDVILALAQGGGLLTPGDQLVVEWPPVPGDVLDTDLCIACRVKHTRRLALDRYHVGALFVDLDSAQSHQIEQLLDRARMPRSG
ncbi:MAG: PilZ domain-containing protein [Gammaproteobacteria bacterium]|nr:PilZ domain-containing protein [Gammaproteobacteria bacterium]